MRELCRSVLQLMRSRCDSKLVQPVKQLQQACREEPLAYIVLGEGLLPKLLRLLKNTTLPELQNECSGLVANFTFHAGVCPRAVVDCGGVPILLRLLKAKSATVRDDAILSLGNIAGEPDLCSRLIASGVPAALAGLYRDDMSLDLARMFAWTCANLATSSRQQAWSAMQPLLPLIERLLKRDDAQLLIDSMVGVQRLLLTAGAERVGLLLERESLLHRIVELLSHREARVVRWAAFMLGRLFTGDDESTSRALRKCSGAVVGLVSALQQHPNPPVSGEACFALSQLTDGTVEQACLVLDAMPMQLLATLLSHSDAKTRSEAAYLLCNPGGGIVDYARVLSDGLLEPLCALVDPQSSDQRLQRLILEAINSALSTVHEHGGEWFDAMAALLLASGVCGKAKQLRANSSDDELKRAAQQLLDLLDASQEKS